jgi:hybrid cluster-associated redox disulfide protein
MINKDMLIYDALQEKPGCQEVFFEFGMHCLGCPVSRGETIEQAAAAHGIELDKLLKALEDFQA